MAEQKVIGRYAERVGYTESEIEKFHEGGHRIRQVTRLSRAAAKYSIQAEVVDSKKLQLWSYYRADIHSRCGRQYHNTIMSKQDVRLPHISTMIPVALINERLSEGLEPNDFHFMRYLHCLDTGVDCYGYGKVCSRSRLFRGSRKRPS